MQVIRSLSNSYCMLPLFSTRLPAAFMQPRQAGTGSSVHLDSIGYRACIACMYTAVWSRPSLPPQHNWNAARHKPRSHGISTRCRSAVRYTTHWVLHIPFAASLRIGLCNRIRLCTTPTANDSWPRASGRPPLNVDRKPTIAAACTSHTHAASAYISLTRSAGAVRRAFWNKSTCDCIRIRKRGAGMHPQACGLGGGPVVASITLRQRLMKSGMASRAASSRCSSPSTAVQKRPSCCFSSLQQSASCSHGSGILPRSRSTICNQQALPGFKSKAHTFSGTHVRWLWR